MALTTSSWKFPLNGKRREVIFVHNTFSGRQTLWMDGERLLHKKWKYTLVGDFQFDCVDGSVGIIRISPAGISGFSYQLFIDNKEISSTTSSVSNEATVWQLPSSGGSTRSTSEAPAAAAAASSPAAADGTRSATVIEFDHTKLEVWIDEVALSLENGELMADFMDDDEPGAVYRFTLPSGVAAAVQVTPLKRGKSSAKLLLEPDGARVEVKPVAAPKGTQSSLAADSAVGSGGGKGK